MAGAGVVAARAAGGLAPAVRHGGPALGVCYYPEHWPRARWRRDAADMAALGLDWVRLGEFTWSRVEPRRGVFDWDWLDEAIAVLGRAGLRILLCTPTAAPPKWLVDAHPEILPVGRDGRVRGFGARRHYCFSSDVYLAEARRITTLYGERYGRNPHVRAWQIDNEFNDHDTALSYSPAARSGFRTWLAARYPDIAALNRAWGTEFWGQHYGDFGEVELPAGAVDEPNPAQALDFRRYSSERVARFCRAQAEILRSTAPGRPITHNFMAASTEFDHHAVAGSLDFVSFDSYPLGNLLHSSRPLRERRRWLRVGDPDYQGFHCDLYRNQGGGRLWITEQQPGPVNWAAHNPAPAAGAVRLWVWNAFAHGAGTILFFRWRQLPFGQEQFHAGLQHADGTPDPVMAEVAEVARERHRLPASARGRARVALVVDYPSRWASAILPQGSGWSGASIAADWYRAMRRLGVDLEVIGPADDPAGFALLLVPDMMLGDPGLAAALAAGQGRVILGPRAGSHDAGLRMAEAPPGVFRQLIDLRVRRVESLPPWQAERVAYGGRRYRVFGWREWVDAEASVRARFVDADGVGAPAIVANRRATYLAMLPRGRFLRRLFADELGRVGIPVRPTGRDLRVTWRGDVGFAFNYGPEPVRLASTSGRRYLVGGRRIAPAGLAIWQDDG